MVNVDKTVIAKLRREGKNFEILVDPEKALELKKGKNVDLNDVVATDEIFYDARKGTKASEHELKKIFNIEDKSEICRIIIMDGNVPQTSDMMKKEVELRRKQIVQIIHRSAVDPKSGRPHPTQRIENAMNEAKIHIDAVKSAADQVNDILKEIRKLIPISFEKQELALKIPAQFSGQALGVLKKYDLKKQEWGNDGSLMAVMEVPAGITQELLNELNHLTHGEFQSKLMEKRKNG